MGLMVQVEQKRLYFKIGASSDTENDDADIYLDLAAALTAVNRKQYHQVTAKGDPLCYTVTIHAVSTSKQLVPCVAPNTWTTRNAAKKTAIGWKRQMKNAGIKLSQLPTYARRFRCAFDTDAVADSNPNDQYLVLHLVPDGCDGTRLFTPYDAPDGGAITYFNSNEVVLLPISEDDPDEAYKACLMGVTNSVDTTFGMVYEFLKSRRNMREETDRTTEFPDSDGLMNTLYAVSEELADDVVAAAEDYNSARPYTEDNAIEPVLGAFVSTNASLVTSTFEAPLGLIKFEGAFGLIEDDEFIIDVHAIYEM